MTNLTTIMQRALASEMASTEGTPTHVWAVIDEDVTRDDADSAAAELGCWVRSIDRTDDGCVVVFAPVAS